MASPLTPYINARILVPGEAVVSQVNGRWVETAANSYLVKLFVSRAQYSGVSAGSVLVPLPSQLKGNMMPGASGDMFYYRGYAIDFATVPNDFDLTSSSEDSLSWQQVSDQYPWLLPGTVVQFKLGDDPIMPSTKIQRSSGRYGGQGIDKILYKEIGGVEIQLSGGQIQD